jgi:hypothetical protein
MREQGEQGSREQGRQGKMRRIKETRRITNAPCLKNKT